MSVKTYIKYTTAELNTVKSRLISALGNCGTDSAKISLYALDKCCNDGLLFRLETALQILTNWQQSPMGDTTGYINDNTLEDINLVVSWSNLYT